MFKSYTFFVLLAALAVAGCVSQGQFLDSKQQMAMQTATSRGQFEMNCPEATATARSTRPGRANPDDCRVGDTCDCGTATLVSKESGMCSVRSSTGSCSVGSGECCVCVPN